MDSLLLYLSKYLHLDHIVFAVINIYVYICSIYGFVHIGVRFLCFKVNKKFDRLWKFGKKALILKDY